MTALLTPSRGFTTRDVPWTKIGTVIDRPVPIAEAMKLSGLDITVSLRRTKYETGAPPLTGAQLLKKLSMLSEEELAEPVELDDSWRENLDRKHIVNDQTGEWYGVASNDYEIVQYADAFTFMDEISPHIVAAGALKDNRQAFMVVQHPSLTTLDLQLGGESDPHQLYAVLRTSHDLSRAVEIALLALRGRCMNELTMQSFAAGAPHRWSVRHVSTVHQRMHEATKVITNLDRWAHELERTALRLAAIDLTIDDAREIMYSVLPNRPRRDDTVNTILSAWQHADDVGFYPTGWGLTQAVSSVFEWGSRGSNRTPQSRLLGALEGSTHKNINRTAAAILGREPAVFMDVAGVA